VKGKLKFVLPLVALMLLGGAYKTVLAEPKKEPEHKVDGQVYVLPKEFLLNLAEDRYAKLSVALILPHDEVIGGDKGHGGPAPPEGFGPLPQEAVVRGLVTDTLTGVSAAKLVSPKGRAALKRKLLKQIKTKTDVHAEDVLFTDVAVQ
jgi:flagellar basal body-associated protein FliL